MTKTLKTRTTTLHFSDLEHLKGVFGTITGITIKGNKELSIEWVDERSPDKFFTDFDKWYDEQLLFFEELEDFLR